MTPIVPAFKRRPRVGPGARNRRGGASRWSEGNAMSEGAATAVAGRTPPATPGGEHVRRPKQWFNHAREYLEDPARAIGAAFELARWERDEKRAEILKRVKDAADSGAWIEAEEDEPETFVPPATAWYKSKRAVRREREERAKKKNYKADAARLLAKDPSHGKMLGLTMTGNLGSVMRESATTALSYLKANAERLGIDPQARIRDRLDRPHTISNGTPIAGVMV